MNNHIVASDGYIDTVNCHSNSIPTKVTGNYFSTYYDVDGVTEIYRISDKRVLVTGKLDGLDATVSSHIIEFSISYGYDVEILYIGVN